MSTTASPHPISATLVRHFVTAVICVHRVADRSIACTSFWHVDRSFECPHLGVDVATIVLSQRAVVWRVDDPLVTLPVIRRLHSGATHGSSIDLSPVRRGLAIFSPSAQLALPSHSLAENMGFWYVEQSTMISRIS